MFLSSRLPWLGTWALLAAGAAAAQDAPAQVAPVAPLSYRSVLEHYQPYAEQPVGSWRDANDTVGRIGGWRAYAREVQDASKAKEASDRPGTPPPTDAPHHQHGNPAGAPR